jgi:DNA-binding NtrC family response regulator
MAALLIVDHDPIIRDNLRRLFADKYECDTADLAEQALELLDVQRYAAIIADISMPAGPGVQILKRLLARRPTTPVIVTSTSGDQLKDLFLETGAFAYFSKPFRFEELESAVAQAVDSLD